MDSQKAPTPDYTGHGPQCPSWVEGPARGSFANIVTLPFQRVEASLRLFAVAPG